MRMRITSSFELAPRMIDDLCAIILRRLGRVQPGSIRCDRAVLGMGKDRMTERWLQGVFEHVFMRGTVGGFFEDMSC